MALVLAREWNLIVPAVAGRNMRNIFETTFPNELFP